MHAGIDWFLVVNSKHPLWNLSSNSDDIIDKGCYCEEGWVSINYIVLIYILQRNAKEIYGIPSYPVEVRKKL